MGRAYEAAIETLKSTPRRWLVTGGAGFIGSHLVGSLLKLGQDVVALDNLETGFRHNLRAVASFGGRLTFVEGDIRDPATCADAVRGCRTVLHQAALGSVPQSLEDPAHANSANVDGFVAVMVAARDAGVERMVYASSSAVYGNRSAGRNVEDSIGDALSPYAVTKRIDELWAGVFERAYDVSTVGLRYFNVFGPRQDPNGAYAAVIPRWIAETIAGRPVTVNGDGSTSRDFCYVDDVVQANILAALADAGADGSAPNIASGAVTDLLTLHATISDLAVEAGLRRPPEPVFSEFRGGDVRHSAADISLARDVLGYVPRWSLRDGLARTMRFYLDESAASNAAAAARVAADA